MVMVTSPLSCLLCILVLVSVVNTLPVPLKLVSVSSDKLTDGSRGNIDSEVFEYFNEELVSPQQCEDMCTSTYPTHTYPVVEHHMACKQGCILAQLGTGSSSCQIECSQLYTTRDERYACSVGCTSPPLQTENNPNKLQRTLISISSVKISSYGLFNFKEELKKWLWGNAYGNEIHWDQQELFNLDNGEELMVFKGHGYQSNPDDLLSLSQNVPGFEFFQSSSQPTLVYVSKSILRTFYYESSFDKLLSYIGLLLLVITAPLLLASVISDCKDSNNKIEEEMKDDLELTKTPCPNCISVEPLPEKLPHLQPVSVYIQDSKN